MKTVEASAVDEVGEVESSVSIEVKPPNPASALRWIQLNLASPMS